MYLVKLVSKVEERQISIAAQKIGKSLNVDPAKVEKRLSKEQAIIGKAKTLEKAEDMASVFRNAGVKVVVVEDEKPAEFVFEEDAERQETPEAKTSDGQARRKVDLGLGIGILFLPVIFAWFTLKKGYGNRAKLVSFVWLGLFVIVGVISNDSESETDGASTTVSSTSEKQEAINSQSQTAEKEEQANKLYMPNEAFVLGDFEYSFVGGSRSKAIGNSFISEQATEGASFVILRVSVKNNSNETKSISVDNFEITDEKGRKFRASSKANTALAMADEDKDLWLSELQPSLKVEMKTAFELPDDALEGVLVLTIPERGFFSTGKAQVRIQ